MLSECLALKSLFTIGFNRKVRPTSTFTFPDGNSSLFSRPNVKSSRTLRVSSTRTSTVGSNSPTVFGFCARTHVQTANEIRKAVNTAEMLTVDFVICEKSHTLTSAAACANAPGPLRGTELNCGLCSLPVESCSGTSASHRLEIEHRAYYKAVHSSIKQEAGAIAVSGLHITPATDKSDPRSDPESHTGIDLAGEA